MTALPGDPLSAAGPGERWVLRVRQPDGSATDVVGWLNSVTSTEVEVTTVDQTVHVLDRADRPAGPPRSAGSRRRHRPGG